VSACERERDVAGLVGAFDDHGFPARVAIGAGAAHDRRELAWRWGVEELRCDLTSGEEERDLTGRLGRCEAGEGADAGVVADLPAFGVVQRVGEDALVAEARAFLAEVDLRVVVRQGELDRLRRTDAGARE
jgi:hypothetical protein